MEEFSLQEVVRVISGGPDLTVIGFNKKRDPNNPRDLITPDSDLPDDKSSVICRWWDDETRTFKRDTIEAIALKKVMK